ncbi:hypothetical protein PQX77_017787 [Marasmius sp. AFHP31]|nr:hypothetical protein PQX77_017787 [Marasmius sp. AFHP31]
MDAPFSRALIYYEGITPFLRLPPELLLLIFKWLVSSTRSSLSLFPIAFVCRSFHSLLRNDPSSWTTIPIALPTLESHRDNAKFPDFTRTVALALNYSRGRPLSLTVNLLHGSENHLTSDDPSGIRLKDGLISDFITRLFRVLPRCRELTIECSLWRDMETLIRLVKRSIKDNGTSLRLESFIMTYNPTHSIEAFFHPNVLPTSPLIWSENPDEHITTPLPCLTNLVINNITHNWPLLTLSGLHTLRLINIPSNNSPSYADLHRILLENAETLTTLELSDISVNDNKAVAERFTVPNLKRMTIGFGHPKDLGWAAKILDLPALEELAIEDRIAGLRLGSGRPWVSEARKRQAREGYRELMKWFPLGRVRKLNLRRVVFYDSGSEGVVEEGKSVPFAFEFLSEFREVRNLEVWHDDSSLACADIVKSSDTLFPNLCSCYIGRL